MQYSILISFTWTKFWPREQMQCDVLEKNELKWYTRNIQGF